jgi:DNA-binding NtrC family response regulator
MSHDWPGNVRELEHVLEGAVLLASGDFVEESDLSMYFHRSERPFDAPEPESRGASPAPDSGSLEDLEKEHIDRVLRQNNFSRTKTADSLGISKKTLYLKIKRYGLKTEE